MAQLLLIAQVAATLVMVGIIWFVQIVHYPLFERVGKGSFPAYAGGHTYRTGLVVGPPMLLELATAVTLLFLRPQGVSASLAWIGLALLAVIWLSTAILQMPRHRALAPGFDPAPHRSLVLSNWLRTAAWTARGVLVLWMIWQAIA